MNWLTRIYRATLGRRRALYNDLAEEMRQHIYAYTGNNPLSGIDPSGQMFYLVVRDGGGGRGGSSIGIAPNPGELGFGGTWNEFDLMNMPILGDPEYGEYWKYIGSHSYGNNTFSDDYESAVDWFLPYIGIGVDLLVQTNLFGPNPTMGSRGGAPSNGNSKQSPFAVRYVGFLACEAAITSNDLANASPASYGALVTGAVGIQQMLRVLNGTAKGVPVVNEMAALLDAGWFLKESIKTNQACSPLFGF